MVVLTAMPIGWKDVAALSVHAITTCESPLSAIGRELGTRQFVVGGFPDFSDFWVFYLGN